MNYNKQNSNPQVYKASRPPPPYGAPSSSQPPPNSNYYGKQYQQPPAQYNDTNQYNYNRNAGGSSSNFITNPQTTATAEKFNKTPAFNDIWAALLFIANLIAFLGVGAFYMNKYFRSTTARLGDLIFFDGYTVSFSEGKVAGMFGIAVVAGGLGAIIYFWLMQKFTAKMIVLSFWLNVALLFAAGIFALLRGGFIIGIIQIGLGVIFVFLWFSWRKRIPFAKVMLRAVCSITKQYPGTISSGIIGLVLQLAFTVFFVASVLAVSAIGSSGYVVLIVYMLFSFYWTSEVIRNLVHVTVSGLFATYYFYGVSRGGNGSVVDVPVKNPTVASFKRAATTSFGSVCFGSLIIAIIQTIRAVIRSAAQNQANDGNMIGAFCLICLNCFMGCIQNLIEYFNKYAYTRVAIYGEDFCTAAKKTWQMLKSRGIDAIINDSLIGNVLGMGALFLGLVVGAIVWFYARNTNMISVTCNNPTKCATTSPGTILNFWSIIFTVAGFFLGLLPYSSLSTVIDSGVATTFVCLADSPDALQRTKPELYQKVLETYPHVMLQA